MADSNRSASSGELMVLAMKSVMQMQADCIKLFEDLDRSMPDLQSFYANVVTLDLGSSINARKYLADGLIRLYCRPKNEAEFLSVNIGFYDLKDPKFKEPIFIAARISYQPGIVDAKEKLKRGWDPWFAFLSWAPERVYDEPITIDRPKNREAIEKIVVVAMPLFKVNSLEKALALIDLVGRL